MLPFTDLSVDVALGADRIVLHEPGMACCCDVHLWEILTEVQHAGFQGIGSAFLLQMCAEHFGGRPVVEALSRLVVEMASKLDELALRHACKVGIAWHVSTDALVDVFHGTFLPRCTGVTKPAPRADAIFPSASALRRPCGQWPHWRPATRVRPSSAAFRVRVGKAWAMLP